MGQGGRGLGVVLDMLLDSVFEKDMGREGMGREDAFEH